MINCTMNNDMESNDTPSDLLNYIKIEECYEDCLSISPVDLMKPVLLSEQVKKLGDGIELIKQSLQNHVLDKHRDLLRQAHHATRLETVVNTMNLHLKNLFANAERLKNQISSTYTELETLTRILSRLNLASHILRQVNRIQQLIKRLTNTSDPVQKATILHELEQLAADEELKQIEVVTSQLRDVREHRQHVVKLATISLNQGLKNENISQTITALQIFINLGTVQKIVESILESSLDESKQSLKLTFDVTSGIITSTKIKGGPGWVNLSTSLGFRSKFWTELEKFFGEDLYQQCKQIKFLQTALCNINIQNLEDIGEKFWLGLGMFIREEMNNSPSAVQQTLEEEYPKLLKNYLELVKKLKYDPFTFNRKVLEKYENSYLSNSLNRLLEPTQSMFISENSIPSNELMDSLIRLITNEISVGLVEEQLSEKIAKNVTKCIKMFAVKTEQQIETGPEVAQVIAGSPNSGQIKNVQLSNALSYFRMQIERLLSNMRESLVESGVMMVNNSLTVLDNLTKAIIHPLIVSTNSTTETIIVTIHQEPDWNKLQVPPNKAYLTCSPYMKELAQFITRVYQTYLVGFENKGVLDIKCNEISVRCIELLVRHTSVLRPISQGGRLRLQTDFIQLETTLKLISPHLADLGQPFRLLKSVASLLPMSAADIYQSQISGSCVPHSTVLLMLFSFAGEVLASPHQNTGWSVTKLSVWLDEHPSEVERLDLVAGAIQRYESIIRQNNFVSFDPVYPIMSKLLEVAVKSLNKL